MDRPASQSGEESAFRDAVGVEVGETCHGLIEDLVQLLIHKWRYDCYTFYITYTQHGVQRLSIAIELTLLPTTDVLWLRCGAAVYLNKCN